MGPGALLFGTGTLGIIHGYTVDERTLNSGNYGIFLIMGNARFISSTAVMILRSRTPFLHLPGCVSPLKEAADTVLKPLPLQ